MSRMSAFGCVARTVLISRARRRRTPTPGTAASVAWAGAAGTRARWARAVPLPVPRAGCGAVFGSGAPLSTRGSGTFAATAASARSASWVEEFVPCCASARAASAALVPVVTTSPATRAPHICQAISLLGRLKRQIRYARFPGQEALNSQQRADRKVGQPGPAVQEGELEQHGQ